MAFNGMIFQNPSVMDVRFDDKSLINDKKEAILDGVVPKSIDGLSGGTIKGDVSVLSESVNSPTLTLRINGSSLIARITVSNEENHIEVNNNKVANVEDVTAAVGNVQTNLDNFVESTTTELTNIESQIGNIGTLLDNINGETI